MVVDPVVEQGLEVGVQRDVAVVLKFADRDPKPERGADLHDGFDGESDQFAETVAGAGENLDTEPGERVGFGSGRSAELGCCGVVEEPGQGPVDARQVTGEQQRSGRRVRVAPVRAAFEEAAEIDQLFFDRGARQRFAGAGAGGGRDPDLEVLDVVAFELGARADPGMALGQPGPEDAQVLFDVFDRRRAQAQADLFDVAVSVVAVELRDRVPARDGD